MKGLLRDFPVEELFGAVSLYDLFPETEEVSEGEEGTSLEAVPLYEGCASSNV